MNATQITQLKSIFQGEIFTDIPTRRIYATDASAYREIPTAVFRPKSIDDIKLLINFATQNDLTLIPRAAGTSLAGQVVGNGLIVDISKHFNKVLEINVEEKYVWVEPGVVLDELNLLLKSYGLFFGPETSTSNRCMIGGMVGNNSCGAHSLVYQSTREHTLALKTILSDGSEVEFSKISKEEFDIKKSGSSLEAKIYQNIFSILSKPENQEEIRNEFPSPEVERRNTGYAIDLLLESEIFTAKNNESFNFCKLLAGSEGTLAFTTAIKLNLVDLPPKHKALICVHLDSVPQATRANLIALQHKPASIELMDKAIMDLSKQNHNQDKNRFFVKDDPGALLIVEFAEESMHIINQKAIAMEAEMRSNGFGWHFPMVTNADIAKVWNLRKAGLGLLSNLPGDAKPVPVIEDTAIAPKNLPEFIDEFDLLLASHKLSCVYYAHIATGELHLRPILNLKDSHDIELFHTIARETALLVKKYKGSLSGEHGDGRLRGEFIPLMIGKNNYELLKLIKQTWDPKGIFNEGKITNTPKMNTFLRYTPGQQTKEIKTIFDFEATKGFIRAVEKCNGSGDCRKSELMGGTMCPSYMATRDEKNTTRARANTLREYITSSTKNNVFNHKEIYDSLDLCLSCKACKSECPSNIDMAKFKAEFLQHYYDSNGISIRTRLIANISWINSIGMIIPRIFNFLITNELTSNIAKRTIGFAVERSIPRLYKISLRKWLIQNPDFSANKKAMVYLFVDEFTNYNDVEIGIKTVLLLRGLGYQVIIPNHEISGRTYLSKGLIRKAKKIAQKNVELLSPLISEASPLVGIEPSAILSFRDEYPDLLEGNLKQEAKELAKNTFLIDEYIQLEVEKGNIGAANFHSDKKILKLHGHCQQKAVASTSSVIKMLSIPQNYQISEIPSGCCGMAGSFGYEKEHYELSMKIGNLVLFPAIKAMSSEEIIIASGTSCRHQIKDGTNKKALHPVEVMLDALI